METHGQGLDSPRLAKGRTSLALLGAHLEVEDPTTETHHPLEDQAEEKEDPTSLFSCSFAPTLVCQPSHRNAHHTKRKLADRWKGHKANSEQVRDHHALRSIHRCGYLRPRPPSLWLRHGQACNSFEGQY